MFGLKGDPVPIPLPKTAQNEAAARRQWDVSEQLTGVVGPLSDKPRYRSQLTVRSNQFCITPAPQSATK
jgi:hypothetical protein